MSFKKLIDILQQEIQPGYILHHITQITQHHRIQASDGYYNAAMYVKSVLEGFGINNLVHSYPANGEKDEWEWTRPITWNIFQGELKLIEPIEKRLCSFKDVPMSVITHSKPTIVRGRVVDIGEGNNLQDYQFADGKIALTTGNPRSIFPLAYDNGVIGLIYHPPQNRIASFGSDAVQYGGFWPNAENFSKILPGFSISHNQALELFELLKESKVELQLDIQAEFEKENGELHVLEAFIEGSKHPENVILFIAHLCHPAKGANDNASGSGTLLEIVRCIRALISQGKIGNPECTLKFLWVPEFSGTIPWLSSLNEKEQKKIIACFNLDMVGECPREVGTPLLITSPSLGTPSYLIALIQALADILKEEGNLKSSKGNLYSFNYRITPFQGGSDHYIFNDAKIAVPSIMFGHDDPYWHSSADDLSKIEPLECRSVAVLAASASLLIASPTKDIIKEIYSNTYLYGLKEILNLKYEKADGYAKIEYSDQLKLLNFHILKRLASIDAIHDYSISSEQIDFMEENIKIHRFFKIDPKELEIISEDSWKNFSNVWYKSNFNGPVPYSKLIQEEKDEENKKYLTKLFQKHWGGVVLEFFNLLHFYCIRDVYLLLRLYYPDIKWEDLDQLITIFERRDLIKFIGSSG